MEPRTNLFSEFKASVFQHVNGKHASLRKTRITEHSHFTTFKRCSNLLKNVSNPLFVTNSTPCCQIPVRIAQHSVGMTTVSRVCVCVFCYPTLQSSLSELVSLSLGHDRCGCNTHSPTLFFCVCLFHIQTTPNVLHTAHPSLSVRIYFSVTMSNRAYYLLDYASIHQTTTTSIYDASIRET